LSTFTTILERVGIQWSRANGTQRALVVGGLAAGILSIALVFLWTAQPDWVVLFSGLDAGSAEPILEELDELGVQYKVSGSGGTVRVPADRVGELRIRIAGKGLAGESTLGYEIFDKSNLGMTEFLQQVNYRRALEGELMRTIVSLEEVRNARVHLAIPEKEVFARDRQPPKASVILDLMPGAVLRNDQVRGIVALVSASVEGLEASGVTLVDSTGRELGGGGSGEFAGTSEQLQIQQEVESHLQRKAVALLDQVVGPGHSVVQVHADLDFERVERSVETYDPASATIRSEERISGTGASGEANETTLTNYEIDKTIERILGSVGTLRRLSVAVLVNGRTQIDEDGAPVYVDRPAEELSALEGVVKDALGFEDERGDTFEIANLRFVERPEAELARSPLPWWLLFPSMGSLLRSLVILAAIGLVAWGLRQSSGILVDAVEADRKRRERIVAMEQAETDEATLRKEVIREQMNALASDRPNEVAQVLRSWLVEEKS
jgi:flagellar M-ring protein FliF